MAKPSPALDLNGDNVPSVASPPISQAPQDTPELTKPLESVPQEPPSSIPSPTAVVEAEVSYQGAAGTAHLAHCSLAVQQGTHAWIQ